MNDMTVAVVGLGYVGLPLAVQFSKKYKVVGFDINKQKINTYKSGHDVTGEVGDDALKQSNILLTSDEKDIRNCSFIVVAVPTPTNKDTTPDLSPLIGASTIVGRNLSKGSIVVYESTVYPGVTEDVCLPILEKESGLKLGKDFKIGYSPERINPGDKVHRVWNIKKVVSGSDKDALETISEVYGSVIDAGVFPVSTIKTAEAVKVLENSQRDVNIAFMNEAAMMFHKMGIDTQEVIDGMNTKWNALGFKPGLVGGHCIGVDPYYLTHAAEQLGYNSKIILAGRKINDEMGPYIASEAVKEMIKAKIDVSHAKVLILGFTFKENCPDARNTKVMDIYRSLEEFGIKADIFDPVADHKEIKVHYGLDIIHDVPNGEYDCVILAVAHREFLDMQVCGLLRNNTGVICDVKSVIKKTLPNTVRLWRL